jgi:hypothetical protein
VHLCADTGRSKPRDTHDFQQNRVWHASCTLFPQRRTSLNTRLKTGESAQPREMRTMSELRFPQWQHPLQDLVLERDPRKLSRKIEDVERLISLRFLRLQNEKNCLDERQALTDALSLLRIVKHYNGPSNGSSASSRDL